jgi:hypothetical protein
MRGDCRCHVQVALGKFEEAVEAALLAEVAWCEEVFPDGSHFAGGA